MGAENEGWGRETPVSKKRNMIYQIIAGAVFLFIMGTAWYTCNMPPFDRKQEQKKEQQKEKEHRQETEERNPREEALEKIPQDHDGRWQLWWRLREGDINPLEEYKMKMKHKDIEYTIEARYFTLPPLEKKRNPVRLASLIITYLREGQDIRARIELHGSQSSITLTINGKDTGLVDMEEPEQRRWISELDAVVARALEINGGRNKPKDRNSPESLAGREMDRIFLKLHRENVRLKLAPKVASTLEQYRLKIARLPGA